LHPSFSNNSLVTAVTHTKRINRNLLGRNETSFVCYTSTFLRKKSTIETNGKLRNVAKIKTQDDKIEPN